MRDHTDIPVVPAAPFAASGDGGAINHELRPAIRATIAFGYLSTHL